MGDDLVFGTDVLRDDVAKLTKICLSVKSGKLPGDDYKHVTIVCKLTDIGIIDFFANFEGNRRLAVTSLLCAGLSKVYSYMNEFPISVFDLSMILNRLMLTKGIKWVLEDVVTLKLSFTSSEFVNNTRTAIYIPKELWGMLHELSIRLGVVFTSLILYLIRTGVSEYNNFVKRFGSQCNCIECEFINYAGECEEVFKSAVGVRYNDIFTRIKFLRDKYVDILSDGNHEKLKEDIEKVISKCM